MKLIKITNDAGAILEIPDSQIDFTFKIPLESEYPLGITGAMIKINDIVLPFEMLKQELLDSDVKFLLFPIPEGTDVIINPSKVLFITAMELAVTAIMFPGGIKCIAAEGINNRRDICIVELPIGYHISWAYRCKRNVDTEALSNRALCIGRADRYICIAGCCGCPLDHSGGSVNGHAIW